MERLSHAGYRGGLALVNVKAATAGIFELGSAAMRPVQPMLPTPKCIVIDHLYMQGSARLNCPVSFAAFCGSTLTAPVHQYNSAGYVGCMSFAARSIAPAARCATELSQERNICVSRLH